MSIFKVTKFFSAIPLGISLFALTVTVAFGGDPAIEEAVNSASQINEVVAATNPATTNCPDGVLPDAPSALLSGSATQGTGQAHLSTLAKVLTKVKFRTSTEIAKDPASSGPLSFSDESLGVTFGDVQISEMLARSGIPNTPETKVYFDVDVTVLPAAAGLAKAAGLSSVAQIKQTEGGTSWEQKDIDNANQRVKSLQRNGLQKVTVSAAVVTKDGKIYACEVGPSPEGFILADSPDGSTNSFENATGGPSDALRLGSSLSTMVGKCKFEKSLKNDSKFMVGIEGYKNTLPYRDLNTTLANGFFSNASGFQANKLGAPDTFRVEGNYTKNVNATTQVVVNGTGGVISGDLPIYSLSGSFSKNGNTFIAATGQSYYTSMTGNDPHDPTSPNYAQKQTGSFLAYTRPIYSNISLVGAYEWDKGVPNSANANNAKGIVNFKNGKVGVEYTHVSVHNPEGDLLSQRQGEVRLTAGVYYQNTTSPDGSLTKTGSAFTAHLKLTTSGDYRSTFKALKGLKVVLPKTPRATVSTVESDCTNDPNAVDASLPRCPLAKDKEASNTP